MMTDGTINDCSEKIRLFAKGQEPNNVSFFVKPFPVREMARYVYSVRGCSSMHRQVSSLMNSPLETA